MTSTPTLAQTARAPSFASPNILHSRRPPDFAGGKLGSIQLLRVAGLVLSPNTACHFRRRRDLFRTSAVVRQLGHCVDRHNFACGFSRANCGRRPSRADISADGYFISGHRGYVRFADAALLVSARCSQAASSPLKSTGPDQRGRARIFFGAACGLGKSARHH